MLTAPDRWEVGSEFHWDAGAVVDATDPAPRWLPARHELFASGSGALTALLHHIGPPRRLHLPSFFCMGVAESLAPYAEIAWYRELPDGAGPRLDTLRAAPGDAVLAVNLFGRGSREPWDAWHAAHPAVTLVEDHSHDPQSDWALTSTASYCVASLRKTLPVPDGGLVWSPRGDPLPTPDSGESPAAGQKLAAMLLKSAWLAGRGVQKSEFRLLQQAGEAGLHNCVHEPTALTRAVLPMLDVWRLRAARAENAHTLLAALSPGSSQLPGSYDDHAGWRVLEYGPVDAVPFHVQLRCESESVRDALLAHLARERIYAPVHWRQPTTAFGSGDPAAIDYASRILTIPADHRYDKSDMHRVAAALDHGGGVPMGSSRGLGRVGL